MTKLFLIKLGIFISLVAIILGCAIPLTIHYRGYKQGVPQLLENLDINATVNEDGSMDVIETWKVKQRNPEYRDHGYFSRTFNPNLNSKIKNITVYDKDLKEEYDNEYDNDPEGFYRYYDLNKYFISNPSFGTNELGVLLPVGNKTKNFEVKYKVTGAISQRLADYAFFSHTFIDEENIFPVKNLNLSITFPEGVNLQNQASFQVYLPNGVTTSSGAPNQISFSTSKLKAKAEMKVETILPQSLFPSMRLDTEHILNTEYIKNNYDEWLSKTTEKAAKERNMLLMDSFIAASVAILIIIASIIIYFKKLKPYKIEVPEYVRTIPKDSSPAQVGILYYYYNKRMNKTIVERMISGTIMSLIEKGYLTISKDKENTLIIEPMQLNQNNDLNTSELVILQLIQKIGSESGGIYTKEIFELYSQNYNKYCNQMIDKFLTEAEKECNRKWYYERRQGWRIVFKILSILGIAATAALFIFTPFIVAPIAMATYSIYMFIFSTMQARLSKRGQHDYLIWTRIKKYMEDFSNLDEYTPEHVEIWKEYLVYATVLGVSTKVVKELKFSLPDIDLFEDAPHSWRFSYTTIGHYFLRARHLIYQKTGNPDDIPDYIDKDTYTI